MIKKNFFWQKTTAGYGIFYKTQSSIKTAPTTKLLTTANKQDFILPTATLAKLIVQEQQTAWQKKLYHLPLTQLSMTCLDLITPNPEFYRTEILNFLEHDTLRHCPNEPKKRAIFYRQIWQPTWHWAERMLAAPLPIITEQAIGRPKPLPNHITLTALTTWQTYNVWQLTALWYGSGLAHSALLAWRFLLGELTIPELILSSEIEYYYQQLQWGNDGCITSKLNSLTQEWQLLKTFLTALQ